jgi:xanthine dehydrogenase YagS FAD-binding subunit
MKAFELLHPTSVEEATSQLAVGLKTARPIAGGQDLLGTMKDYLLTPSRVVDLKKIPGLSGISHDGKGLHIGALTTITEVEEHPVIQKEFPAIAEAARSVATIQIRNVGTVGGNLCQKPRCWYFRNERIICLKKGGTKCYASDDSAENKYNAILGGGPSFFVHPSDLAPALMCLGATLTIAGPGGKTRSVPLDKFFTLPQDGDLLKENVLEPGEIITQIFVPNSAYAGRSTYLKFREKGSLDFAISAVAMALTTKGNTVSETHIVLGGVAPKPWPAPAAEAALNGKALSADNIEAAAQASTQGSIPLEQNGYKVPLTQALVRRAANMLAAGPRVAFSGREEDGSWTE